MYWIWTDTALFVPDDDRPVLSCHQWICHQSPDGYRFFYFFEINPIYHKETKDMMGRIGFGNIEERKDMFDKLRFIKAKKMKEISEQDAFLDYRLYVPLPSTALTRWYRKCRNGDSAKKPGRHHAKVDCRKIHWRWKILPLFRWDKIRYSKWGRRKIEQALWMKRIEAGIQRNGIDAVDDEEYPESITPIDKKQTQEYKRLIDRIRTEEKLIRFALGHWFWYKSYKTGSWQCRRIRHRRRKLVLEQSIRFNSPARLCDMRWPTGIGRKYHLRKCNMHLPRTEYHPESLWKRDGKTFWAQIPIERATAFLLWGSLQVVISSTHSNMATILK